MTFPIGYKEYDGLEVFQNNSGEYYLHCVKIDGCKMVMDDDISQMHGGEVSFEYWADTYGAYIDFILDDAKITIEYYANISNGEVSFVYDIKIYDSDGNLLDEIDMNAFGLSKTLLKIQWYGGNKVEIYKYDEYSWGKIWEGNIDYTNGSWYMNIKGTVNIDSLCVYRRWFG